MNLRHYPTDWRAISLRIRERDGWRCKFCGVRNGAYVVTERDGSRWETDEIGAEVADVVDHQRVTRIVLTVAHLPEAYGPMDCRDEVLAALCQRCHLRLDAAQHARNAAETRRKKRIARGQTELFPSASVDVLG